MPRQRVKRDGEATVWIARLKGTPYLVIRWIDAETGQTRQRSSGCTRRRDAERVAATLAEKIEDGIVDREYGWHHFRDRYEREKLAGRKPGTRANWDQIANRYDAEVHPQSIQQAADPRRISTYVGRLRAAGLSEETIAGHVRYLHAAFQWAADLRLIRLVPRCKATGERTGRHMRGRPATPAEFRRLLRASKAERPDDWRAWTQLLRGLWLSGLRIGEARILSWDAGAGFAVDLSGRHPAFRIRADSQKSGRDEVLPMTPDFARWILRTPPAARSGHVFPLPGKAGQMTGKGVQKIVSAIGRRAGIEVGGPGKYATAHDLRRSFGTRWAQRVMPAVLQKLMRHQHLETTTRYYVDIAASEIAADLWRDTPNVILSVTSAVNGDAAG